MKKQLYTSLILLIAFLNFSNSYSATRTAISTGNWTNIATWDCNCIPATTDNILIPSGIRVTIGTPGLSLIDLTDEIITIAGELRLSSAALVLNSSDIVVLTSTGTITAIGLGGVVSSGLTPFTNFPINGPATITNSSVPVVIDYFYLVAKQDAVIVSWGSSTEEELDFYWIERSDDGLNFDVISKIRPSETDGLVKKYEFHDLLPIIGNSYYRIRAVDIDGGSEAFSVLAIVRPEGVPNVNLYPNPITSNTLTIRSNFDFSTSSRVVIASPSGKTLLNATLAGFETTIDVGGLPSGVYLAEIKTALGEFKRRLIIR